MELFERFETQLKANPKTIVFTEGPDARIPVSYTNLDVYNRQACGSSQPVWSGGCQPL